MRAFSALLPLFLAFPATALTVTVYTDRAAWEIAAGAFVTETFELAPIEFVSTSGGTIPLEFFTIDIDANHGNIGIVSDASGNRSFVGDVHSDADDPPEFNRILLDTPSRALGLDLLSIEDPFEGVPNFFLKLEDLDSLEWPGISGPGFLGFLANEPVSTVYFETADYQFFSVDNISVASIPEPNAGLLVLGGMLGICAARRVSRGAPRQRRALS